MNGNGTHLTALRAELERLDLLLAIAVRRAREQAAGEEELRGLYVGERDVDDAVSRSAGPPPWSFELHHRRDVDGELRLREDALAERRRQWLTHYGEEPRLELLARRFGLSDFERDALLVCLAPEVDLRYETLYAYLHDDVGRKRPSVDLVSGLFCPDLASRLAARRAFSPRAPLFRHGLLAFADDPARPTPPLPRRTLEIDERVAGHLLGDDTPDPRLAPFAERLAPTAGLDALSAGAATRAALRSLVRPAGGAEVIYLQGDPGDHADQNDAGGREAASALCHERGQPVVEADLARLLGDGPRDAEGARSIPLDRLLHGVDVVLREAALSTAATCWRGFDELLDDARRGPLELFLRRLVETGGLHLLLGAKAWEPGTALTAAYARVELPALDATGRAALWARHLGRPPDDAELRDLAGRFRLDRGQVGDAAATARRLAARGGFGVAEPDFADLAAACRLHSAPHLGHLAQKVPPHYRWDDVVLPDAQRAQLREIGDHLRHRARVHGDWGFDRKLALGKGLVVLFSGPSGTGKTMAADVLAGELGLDLYRIDLANVVSKYIGETEKSLARIFAAAESANAVLLFDEADALFGKRSEVRDAHDRYANVEVGYLLQRMEAYRGMAILATNLADNLDRAFVRRMHFIVEFPFPDPGARRRIWQGVLPAELPRGADLDLDFLAERFEITGGHIRNIALAGAFLAAADGGRLTMDLVLHATRREYQKMGRTALDGEFER